MPWTHGGLLSAELGVNQNLCQINRFWASTEAGVCSLQPCDFCLLCLAVLLAAGGAGSLFLLTRWNSRWICVWVSLLAGSKLIPSQKYFTCHRNIICIKIWTMLIFFFHLCSCVFLLFILPGLLYVIPFKMLNLPFFYCLWIWFASRNLVVQKWFFRESS